MATSAERRKFTRHSIPCRLKVAVAEGSDLRVRTRNISDGGAYFVTDEVLEVGRKVRVRLAVPRDTANTFFLEQFAAEAKVVRLEPPAEGESASGVALVFEKVLALDLP
jgi:c-di-GMP-binding flagellar brake protein YcgR